MVIAQEPEVDLTEFIDGLDEPLIIGHPGLRVGSLGCCEQDGLRPVLIAVR